jgi:hypothetical protein
MSIVIPGRLEEANPEFRGELKISRFPDAQLRI